MRPPSRLSVPQPPLSPPAPPQIKDPQIRRRRRHRFLLTRTLTPASRPAPLPPHQNRHPPLRLVHNQRFGPALSSPLGVLPTLSVPVPESFAEAGGLCRWDQ